MSSNPNANPVINPNDTSTVTPTGSGTTVTPTSSGKTSTTMKMPSMKMSDFSSQKKSIDEILNKDSVKGMDLKAYLDGLTENVVAIACLHKNDFFVGEKSSVINNMEKSLKNFTAVKLTGVPGNEIDVLNKFPDTTNAKCEVLDSKNNKNITEISEPDAKTKYAQLFTLIKSAISSETNISTGKVRDSKKTEIEPYNTVLGELSGGVDLKFAGENPCTQVVFGVQYENDEVKKVVGRIQSVGSGTTGAVETGDFSMDLDGEKYVITAGKDAGITVKTILKKILNTGKKPIEVKVEETKPAEEEQAGQAGQVQAGQVQGQAEQTTTTAGGKSKRRRHKKKGTRKHKPKRTMKKRKSSHRRSSKK